VSAPPAVRAAVAELDGTILCLGCMAAVALVLPGDNEPVVISHPDADCEYWRDPDSPGALELARYVHSELATRVLDGDYWVIADRHGWLVSS